MKALEGLECNTPCASLLCQLNVGGFCTDVSPCSNIVDREAVSRHGDDMLMFEEKEVEDESGNDK